MFNRGTLYTPEEAEAMKKSSDSEGMQPIGKEAIALVRVAPSPQSHRTSLPNQCSL